MEKQLKIKTLKSLYKNALELILVGGLTGIFVGFTVTVFNLLAHEGEEISSGVYAYVRANPAFIPLLLLALAVGAFLIGTLLRVSEIIRGCGIPHAEGATRGSIRFRWWRDATAMFAASLLGVFMGLSVGAEGPSVFIGAACGDGVATITKRNEMIKRYQITGGACAGLAVAANAPLTGMAFAFEEAHKRFTPEVFICAFSSVVFALLTQAGVCFLFGETRSLTSSFSSYAFFELPFAKYGVVVLSAVLCALAGVLFLKFSFLSRRLFKKIRVKDRYLKFTLRIMVAVLIGGVLSLLTASVMGGGHNLIESLGTSGGERALPTAFGLSFVWAIFLVMIAKFFITGVNIGAGIPCGVFVPVIAIGACIGAALNQVYLSVGWIEKEYCDLIVMICMAAFFTTIVRAPLTGIIMVCEFTWSFAPLLPVVIGVAIGYVIGTVSTHDGLYEELLEMYLHESGTQEHAEKEMFFVTVKEGSLAEKRCVRDILWPNEAKVTKIVRGEEIILPDADTVFHAGDILTVVCRTDAPQKIRDELSHVFG